MQLLTKQLTDRFEKIGSQEKSFDPVAIAKFFNAGGQGNWYATEYDPKEEMFFGYVSIFEDHNDEWGSFSLKELKSVRGPFGLGIERDMHFKETPVSEIIENIALSI